MGREEEGEEWELRTVAAEGNEQMGEERFRITDTLPITLGMEMDLH